MTLSLTFADLVNSKENKVLEANKLLIEIKKELRGEKSTRLNDKIDFYNKRKDLEALIRSLDREIEDVRIQCIKLENELIEVESKRDGLRADVEGLKIRMDEVKKFILGRLDYMKARARSLFPSEHEEKVKELAILTTKFSNPKSDFREGLKGLFGFVRDEINSGRTIKVYQGKVLLSDHEIDDAQILRIGKLTSLYLSPNGEEAGILLKREGVYDWESGLDEVTKTKIKDVIQGLSVTTNVTQGISATTNVTQGFSATTNVTQGFSATTNVTQGFSLDKFNDVEGKNSRILGIPMDVTVGKRTSFEGKKSKGVLSFFMKGGPVMIPLLLVGIVGIILILERMIFLRRNRTRGDGLIEGLYETIKEKGYDEAKEHLRKIKGPLGRILGLGLSRIERGREAVQEAIEEATLAELPRLNRFLSVIGILGSISPLLGLLGTVSGMISTFDVITRFGSGDPKLMSGGISEALITTEVGLAIAIPVLLLHNHLSNKVETIANEIEKYSARFINTLFP